MKIVIRADSAIHIGTGHIMRCLVLAKELTHLGHDISFAIWHHGHDFTAHIQNQGYEVTHLIHEGTAQPLFNGDYKNWLPVTEQQDATQFLLQVSQADLVIVDHYSLSIEWETMVKEQLNCFLISIDDIQREHYCDLLLDQTLNRKDSDYQHLCPQSANLYTGTEYALLNPRFAQLKQHQLASESKSEFKLLVAMGGIDNSNVTMKVLHSLVNNPLPEVTQVSVIINPNSPFHPAVKEYCQIHNHIFTQYDFIHDMADFMSEHQLAIGAPGGSTWERACLGIPSIVIPVADNQKDICNQLVINGIALMVALDSITTQLSSKLTLLIRNYQHYQSKNQSLCDGLGAKRVAARVNNITTTHPFYRCRFANHEDIELTYQWQCLPETRKYALNSAVPSFAEHKLWMTKKLQNPDDFYYLIEIIVNDETKAVGVVRLDHKSEGLFIISIYIDPQYYGLGIASDTLNYINIVHPEITIEATVLKQNLASQALFTKAGYKQINPELYIKSPLLAEERL